jgi:hypothetical protein
MNEMKKLCLVIASLLIVSCVQLKPFSVEEYQANKKMELISKLPNPPSPAEVEHASYGKLPNDYQKMIKSYLAFFLKDPYSAIYEFNHKPVKGYIQDLELNSGRPTFGWLVNFNYNAKNSYGAYTGKEYTQFFVYKDINDGNYYARPTSKSSFDYIFVETK